MIQSEVWLAEQLDFDENRLGSVSRALAKALFNLGPIFRAAAKMEIGAEPDGCSLVISASSPTGDPMRKLEVWLDENSIPSVEFGNWHTHADVITQEQSISAQVAAVVDIVSAILQDQFVIICDVGGEHPGYSSVLDLRLSNALEDELTNPYSPGRIRIKSWSGKQDRDIGT
jgi:hypothetical protein